MTDKEVYIRVRVAPDIKGTTVNERLYLTGLTDVFDRSMNTDKK